MSIFETTADDGQTSTWRQLESTDYWVIGFTTGVDMAAAILTAHVIWEASWPAYASTVPHIVAFSSLAAISATIGVSMRYGMWGAADGWVECNVVAWLTWLGLGALFSSAFLRVYRYHNILIRQSGDMRPLLFQLIGALLPCTLAPALLASPGLATYDSVSTECQGTSSLPEIIAFVTMAALAVSTMVLTFQLKVARQQAPDEFEIAVGSSATVILASIALPCVHFETEVGQEGRREWMLSLTTLLSLAVVGIPMLRALPGYVMNERQLRESGYFNFGKWRSEEQVSHRIVQCMRLKEAATSPGRLDNEEDSAVVKFFRILMARERIESYSQLQASTMRILGTYYRAGSPSATAVPMSDACRSVTLTLRASSIYIFDETKAEVLRAVGIPFEKNLPGVMGAFESGFKVSPATSLASSQPNGEAPSGREKEEKSPSPSHSQLSSRAAAIAALGGSSIFEEVSLESTGEVLPTHESATKCTDLGASNGLSPLRELQPLSPSGSSPLNPYYAHQSAAAVNNKHHDRNMGLSPMHDHRGSGGGKGQGTEAGITSSDGSRSVISPMLSFFGAFRGGRGGRVGAVGRKSPSQSPRAVDHGSSDEPRPDFIHMEENTDADSRRDSINTGQGRLGGKAEYGRARGTGDENFLRVAGVGDVHTAFGLDRSGDAEESTQEFQLPSLFSSGKKKKQKHPRSHLLSAVSGYSGTGCQESVFGSSCSSLGDGTDLAEAARQIPAPLFGDSTRMAGRQGTRSCGGSERNIGVCSSPSSGGKTAGRSRTATLDDNQEMFDMTGSAFQQRYGDSGGGYSGGREAGVKQGEPKDMVVVQNPLAQGLWQASEQALPRTRHKDEGAAAP